MPPARRRAPSTAVPVEPAVPAPAAPTFSLNLPFLSVSVVRPASSRPAAGTDDSPGAAVAPWDAVPPTAQKVLFYGGVAALGVAGVVEWPVVAAIAAGTWLAGRTRSGGPTPPAGRTPPAERAGAEPLAP